MGRAGTGRATPFVMTALSILLVASAAAVVVTTGRDDDVRPAVEAVGARSDAAAPVGAHEPDGRGACPRRRAFLDERSGTVLPRGAVGVTWCVGPAGASDPLDTMVTRGPREVLRSRPSIERLTAIVNRTTTGGSGCGDSSSVAELGLAFTYPDGSARLVRTSRSCPGRLQIGTRQNPYADRLLSVYAEEVARARRSGSLPWADVTVRCARGEDVLGQFERVELVGDLGRVVRARLCPLAGRSEPRARDLTRAELRWLRTTPTRAAEGSVPGPLRAVVVATTGWGDRIPIAIHERGAVSLIGPTRRLPLRTWPLPSSLRDLGS